VHAPSGDTAPGAKVKRRAPAAKKAAGVSKGAAKNAKKKKAAAK
jgi:hypothetical protein